MEIDEIKSILRSKFDPIAMRIGLEGPYEEVYGHSSFSFGYFSRDLGLEVRVDMSDFFIYVLVFRTQQNNIPIGYKDQAGHRQKLYFQEALKELSLGGQTETKELKRLGGDYRNCEKMASLLATLVEEKWSLVASQKSILFPTASDQKTWK